MKTIIVVDSCCDLPLSYVEENSDYLDVIGMPVNINDFDYFDDLGKTFTHDEFYSKLREGIIPSTAQINAYRFLETFSKHLNDGNSIIYIGFSSNLSGTYNSSLQGIELSKEDYPNGDILSIDSKSASIGQGLLVMKAIEMIKENQSKDSIVEWIESRKLDVRHWFAVDDLNYLKKGGRISSASAAIGTLLSVKPILTVSDDGVLETHSKVKGRKKSIKFLANEVKKEHKKDKYQKIIIGHGNVKEDAEVLKEMLHGEIEEENIIISELSATIASHVGPGMLAIAFLGDTRN